MRKLILAASLLGLCQSASAKLMTDKSGSFQYEVPDGFVAKSQAGSTTAVSPDQKIIVSSLLAPAPAKTQSLTEIAKSYSAAQEKSGKIPQRAGSVSLGGTEGMAIETLDKKGTNEYSFITRGKKGLAIVVVEFRPPVKANPSLFSQLVARSFRWLEK